MRFLLRLRPALFVCLLAITLLSHIPGAAAQEGGSGPGTYDNTSPAITYSGTWGHVIQQRFAYQETLSWTTGPASAFFTFNGQTISYFYSMAYNRGNVEIYIDGVLTASFSAYAPDVRRQVGRTWKVSPGTHTIEVRRIDGYMDLDAFIVDVASGGQGTYDDTHANVRFVEFTNRMTNVANAWQQTISYSNIAGRVVWMPFNGNKLHYFYSTGPNRGIASVVVDGQVLATIDMWSANVTRQQVQSFYNLGPGPHIVHILVTGNKNTQSSDITVDIDKFDVVTN